MFENPRTGRQARNFTTNVPKILDLKSSSEQIFSKNSGWVPLLKDLNYILTKRQTIVKGKLDRFRRSKECTVTV